MLIGHEHAISTFMEAANGDRLHHAWLLTGPRGVGKALFARLAARRLLAEAAGPSFDLPGFEVPANHPIAALLDANSHPDLMILDRIVDEKSGAQARSILIDQVRGLQRLFATTGSYSSRRIVIIDAVDDLERGGGNALLKNLEEPPTGSLFLLVSHAPGRLLPTIRSRCRTLRFQALGADVMTQLLHAELPNADASEIAGLVRAGEGAPGRALSFAGLDINGLDAAIERLVTQGDAQNAERSALGRNLALKANHARYEAFLERAPARIAVEAAKREGRGLEQALAIWEEARALAASAVPLSLDVQSTTFRLAGLLADMARDPYRPG
ncbi:MAG: AAA family ATPase [Sphingomonadaceae bacterium]